MQLSKKCTGCGACATICSQNAINIKLDENGFYHYQIDKEKCIECGVCKNVCVDKIGENAYILDKSENYIASSRDEFVFNKSSSGGIGYILAKKFVEKGYSVCGVQYNKEKEIVEHIIVNSVNELEKIQGSKYLQSYSEEAFKEMVKLNKGVIFGTPCQIAGIDAVLKKLNKRNNFILIDIFCHGVPSKLAFDNHLKYLKKKHKVNNNEEVKFRNKKEFKLEIGNNYKKLYQYDSFYFLFLRGLIFQEACYQCKYRRKTFADIRLGDFTYEKYKNLKFSPSNIIINTGKGKEAIDSIMEEIYLYKENYDIIDKVQDNGEKNIPKEREMYLNKLKKGIPPDVFLRKEMILSHIKGFIKVLLKILKKENKENKNNLNEVMNNTIKQ